MTADNEPKSALLLEIGQVEGQLHRAEKEAGVWNRGKYKSHSNAQMSRLLVDSLRKRLSDLYQQLAQLERD